MKIVIFSDSHGNKINMMRVLKAEHPDMCVFLGDGLRDLFEIKKQCPSIDFSCVSGNCDSADAPVQLCLNAEGFRIFATHGHEYGVKYDRDLLRLRYAAEEQNADIALYGHTHAPYLDHSGGLYVMNPGSIGRASAPSYGLITVEHGSLRVTLKSAEECV